MEETVPDGFEAADPKAIVLTENGDVQRISLENEEKYINVLKVVNDGTAEYAVTGATLALYRSDADGNLLEDESHLVDTWTSGSTEPIQKRISLMGICPIKRGTLSRQDFCRRSKTS